MIYSKVTYKYKLERDMEVMLKHFPTTISIRTKYINMEGGILQVKAGYYCDGASGPTVDTKNAMRGAFIHDALYQLIREGHLDFDMWKTADKELHHTLRLDGMSKFRAWYWLKGLRLARGSAAKPTPKTLYRAP